MESLIIVGAGGLASDLYGYLASQHFHENTIKGILSDNIDDYTNLRIDETYLGKIDEYIPEENDRFLVAIGENPGRKKIIDLLESKNAKFFTFVHQTAIVHHSAVIEEGGIIGPFCTIGSNAKLGRHTFLNKYCNIGHDCKIGSGMIMYPYAMIGGHSKVGVNFILSTRSTVFPKLVIGDNCIVSAHIVLEKNSDDNMLYFNANTQLKKMKFSSNLA